MYECEKEENEYYAWQCSNVLLLNLSVSSVLYVYTPLIQYTVIVFKALVHEEV